MKNILCFGDSNCFGTVAEDHVLINEPSRRRSLHERWTGILQDDLGEAYHVIEEGLSGRTTIYQLPGEEYKNAETYLVPCLMSHRPLDLIIMMLGTNDLRLNYQADLEHLDKGMRRLVDMIRSMPYVGNGTQAPPILIVSPIDACRPTGRTDFFDARGGEICIERFRQYQKALKDLAAEKGCMFFNAAAIAFPDQNDGMHLTAKSHFTLGHALAREVKEFFKA